MLAVLLKVLLNIMLIGSMLAFVGACVWGALADGNVMERMIRFGMLFSGALVVLGAQASGLTFSQLITTSLSGTGAFPVVTGVVIPGTVGASLGLFLIRSAHNGSIYAFRIMIFVGMLATAQFAELYANALGRHGLELSSTILPNISFVVGILLCLALTLDPRNPQKGIRILAKMRSTRLDNSEPPAQRSYTWPDQNYGYGERRDSGSRH